MPPGDASRSGVEIARLQEQLRVRQQQLVEETARNERAKIHAELFNSLILASAAMGQLALAEKANSGAAPTCSCGGPAACAPHAAQQQQEQERLVREALDALERQLDILVRSLDRGGSSSSGGRGGYSQCTSVGSAMSRGGGRQPEQSDSECSMGDASSQLSGTQQPTAAAGAGHFGCSSLSSGSGGSSGTAGKPGLLGLTVSDFLREIVGGRSLVGSKEDFITYWRQSIMGLALMAHQYRSGSATRGMVEKSIYEMGVRFGALFTYGNYVLEVIVLDMETGLVCEAPQTLWDRVAAALALTPDQALAFALLHRWWKSSTQAFQEERAELTRAALAAPTDLELQQKVVEGLERVNRGYLSAAVAVLAVTMFGVTRPEQVAASWITCWPRMPLMTAIFDALERRMSV